jgi:hypothetical protein
MLRCKKRDKTHVMSRCKQVDRRDSIAVVTRMICYEPDSLSCEYRRKSIGKLVDTDTNMNLG